MLVLMDSSCSCSHDLTTDCFLFLFRRFVPSGKVISPTQQFSSSDQNILPSPLLPADLWDGFSHGQALGWDLEDPIQCIGEVLLPCNWTEVHV